MPQRTAPPDGEAQRRLVEYLRARDFQGPAWELFIGQLTAFGRNYLHKSICNSRIFKQCLAQGRPVGTSPDREFLREHRAAREMLVMDVLAATATQFRENALRGGAWQPSLGSSLRSYYVGALVLEFPNAYRRWLTRWRSEDGLHLFAWQDLLELERLDGRMFILPAPHDPAHQVAVSDLLERTLATGDDEIRKIAELRKLGWEWDEVGAKLGKSGNAASEKWRRFCAGIRQQHGSAARQISGQADSVPTRGAWPSGGCTGEED
ncbi:hypothetical protein CFP65_2036 [Kitasatospora sp. MMS16-BH015]|uniref:hypothetical protein n=1 Tax=Kitasatospora sp. MMS16-BH015 TaxID=2018025 RepID=UPI000CA2ADB7|nr:hypothetical protein [Kitasatospora sp. MMS16-BH015]AUG76896.1 hypothetical protein CFP65_2036 [Kitasatospora sp. MMS16-BH015]